MVAIVLDDENENPEAVEQGSILSEEVEIVELKSMTSRPVSLVFRDMEDATERSDSGRRLSEGTPSAGDKSSLLGTATGDNSFLDNSDRPESSMTEKDSRRSSIFSSRDIPWSETEDRKQKDSRPVSAENVKSFGIEVDITDIEDKYKVSSDSMYQDAVEDNSDEDKVNIDPNIKGGPENGPKLNTDLGSPIFSLVSHQVQGSLPDVIVPHLVRSMIPIFEPDQARAEQQMNKSEKEALEELNTAIANGSLKSESEDEKSLENKENISISSDVTDPLSINTVAISVDSNKGSRPTSANIKKDASSQDDSSRRPDTRPSLASMEGSITIDKDEPRPADTRKGSSTKLIKSEIPLIVENGSDNIEEAIKFPGYESKVGSLPDLANSSAGNNHGIENDMNFHPYINNKESQSRPVSGKEASRPTSAKSVKELKNDANAAQEIANHSDQIGLDVIEHVGIQSVQTLLSDGDNIMDPGLSSSGKDSWPGLIKEAGTLGKEEARPDSGKSTKREEVKVYNESERARPSSVGKSDKGSRPTSSESVFHNENEFEESPISVTINKYIESSQTGTPISETINKYIDKGNMDPSDENIIKSYSSQPIAGTRNEEDNSSSRPISAKSNNEEEEGSRSTSAESNGNSSRPVSATGNKAEENIFGPMFAKSIKENENSEQLVLDFSFNKEESNPRPVSAKTTKEDNIMHISDQSQNEEEVCSRPSSAISINGKSKSRPISAKSNQDEDISGSRSDTSNKETETVSPKHISVKIINEENSMSRPISAEPNKGVLSSSRPMSVKSNTEEESSLRPDSANSINEEKCQSRPVSASSNKEDESNSRPMSSKNNKTEEISSLQFSAEISIKEENNSGPSSAKSIGDEKESSRPNSAKIINEDLIRERPNSAKSNNEVEGSLNARLAENSKEEEVSMRPLSAKSIHERISQSRPNSAKINMEEETSSRPFSAESSKKELVKSRNEVESSSRPISAMSIREEESSLRPASAKSINEKRSQSRPISAETNRKEEIRSRPNSAKSIHELNIMTRPISAKSIKEVESSSTPESLNSVTPEEGSSSYLVKSINDEKSKPRPSSANSNKEGDSCLRPISAESIKDEGKNSTPIYFTEEKINSRPSSSKSFKDEESISTVPSATIIQENETISTPSFKSKIEEENDSSMDQRKNSRPNSANSGGKKEESNSRPISAKSLKEELSRQVSVKNMKEEKSNSRPTSTEVSIPTSVKSTDTFEPISANIVNEEERSAIPLSGKCIKENESSSRPISTTNTNDLNENMLRPVSAKSDEKKEGTSRHSLANNTEESGLISNSAKQFGEEITNLLEQSSFNSDKKEESTSRSTSAKFNEEKANSRPTSTKSTKEAKAEENISSAKSVKESEPPSISLASALGEKEDDIQARPISAKTKVSEYSSTEAAEAVPSAVDETDSETMEIMEGDISINGTNDIEEDAGGPKVYDVTSSNYKYINDNAEIQEDVLVCSDLSQEDYKMIVKLFQLYDEDNSGTMSSAELGNMMRSMGLFPTDDEVEELAQFMDGDGSGKIELNELVKNMAFQIQLRKKVNPGDEFKEAFKVFDIDGNGNISCSELKRILTELGQMKLSTEEVDDLISMVDKDGDSLLDYSEFVEIFTQKLVI